MKCKIISMENASYYDALEIKEELENLGYLRKKKVKQLPKKTQYEQTFVNMPY